MTRGASWEKENRQGTSVLKSVVMTFFLTVVCLFNFISGRVTSQKRSHVEQTIRLSVVMEAEIFQYTIAQSHR
jgi:hypothetical protein